jgi:Kef-type K+ transport system membrane component KefB
VLLVGFAALAESLGLEVILGAFAAGARLGLLDRDETMTHPLLRVKLEGAGYGVFIPVFFVWSGLQFDLGALGSGGSTLARVPLFLAALLAVRGLPALLYRLDARRTAAAALLQATSLPFIVAAAQIGMELGKLSQANGAALVAAGLGSVLLFPLGALAALRAPGAERGEQAVPRLGLE